MVRRPVGPGEAGAVEAKHDVQVLQRHVVNHLVVAALHKRRVDIAERHQSLRRHPGRKYVTACCSAMPTSKARSGMAAIIIFKDEPLGMAGVTPIILVVGLGQFQQRVAKHVLVLRRLGRGRGTLVKISPEILSNSPGACHSVWSFSASA